MLWKAGDRIIYPGHLPGTVEIVHDEGEHSAVVVLLDSGGRELLYGPAEIAMLKPEPVARGRAALPLERSP